MTIIDPYNSHNRDERLRERVMNVINDYLTNNRIMKSLRMIEYLGDDHRYLKSNGVDMNVVNHYRTDNHEKVYDRIDEFLGCTRGRGTKNYNINKIKFFRDIPDGIEILIDYVDVTAIRTMNIPTEIIYESIYRKLPELFDE